MAEDAAPREGVSGPGAVTLRCGFCLALNRVDLSRAAERPKCGGCGKPFLLDRPFKVAPEDFDRTVLGAEAPVLVDFFADWCGPCKMVAPVMDDIAHRKTGRLLVAKLDTDQAPEVADRFRIRGIPTIILFEGGKEAGRSVGFDPEEIRALADRAAP